MLAILSSFVTAKFRDKEIYVNFILEFYLGYFKEGSTKCTYNRDSCGKLLICGND